MAVREAALLVLNRPHNAGVLPKQAILELSN